MEITPWISQIKALLARDNSGTWELARTLWSAKQKLVYGQWTALWKSGQIPFSKRKGERLAAIAQRLDWADATTLSQLPTGWSVLYCLSRMEKGTLQRFIQEGIVHPALTLTRAKELLGSLKGKAVLKTSRLSSIKRQLRRLQTLIAESCHSWSAPEKEFVQTQLTAILTRFSVPVQHTYNSATIIL